MPAALTSFFRWRTFEGRRIDLDFVRGVAILLACGWHFNQATGIGVLDWLLAPGRRMGWAGVDLFFVLSGFLIGGLLFAEFGRNGDFNATRFLIRRAFKIWPVLYGFLFLQLVLNQHPWKTYFLQCLFHLQNYLPTPLGHLWSLAVEEQFYLFFAIIYAGTLGIWGTLRLMPWVLSALMIVPLIARSAAVATGVLGPEMMQTQYRIDALACGLALAFLHAFHRELFERIASYKIPLLICWVSGSWMISTNFAYGDFMRSIGYTLVYLSAAAFLLFCYGLRYLVGGAGPARLIAQLGLFSYGIYICQYAAVRPAAALTERLHLSDHLSAVIRVALDYGGALAAGVIVTLIVERPALILRNRLFPDFSRRPQRPDPAALPIGTDHPTTPPQPVPIIAKSLAIKSRATSRSGEGR